MRFILLFFIFLFASSSLMAGEVRNSHGLSLFGAPKLDKDFTHFPYVNPAARKGGAVRIAAVGGYDNINPFTIKGNLAQGVGLLHATLMTPSLAEPSAVYGLIAKSVSHPADFSSVVFSLRKEARFSDGTKITAADVAYSLRAISAAHPHYRAYYRDVEGSEILSPHKIKFNFKVRGNRELPLILGALPILKKDYWQEAGLDKTTLTPPPVSGAYTIARVEAGRQIEYHRRQDYWAGRLNVGRGQNNFDKIIYIYFGDDSVAFEALKAGDVDYRYEFSSRLWATGYQSPSIAAGKLKKKTIALKTGAGMQAFIFNLRRDKFGDARVREALNLAFDFEWANKNLFYGQYARSNSFFERSELAAYRSPNSLPSAAEQKLLKSVGAPSSALQKYMNPTSDASGNIRLRLRQAKKLLAAAGWRLDGQQLKRDGRVFNIEFLVVQPAFTRIIAPYIQNLAKLGIIANIRVVDASQYQNRLREYDFDAITGGWGQSLSPGNEQRNYWGSAAADIPGGRNYAGIKDAAVDAVIEEIIAAASRAELITATRALDRLLLANHYVVPQWYVPYERLAFWGGLRHPERFPDYGLGFPNIWWSDKGGAAR